jgi:hypothetical protein
MTSSYIEIIRLAALLCKPNPSLAELKELDFGLSEIGDAALGCSDLSPSPPRLVVSSLRGTEES